jgi:hypothetical protein
MTVTRTRMDSVHLSVGWEVEARQWSHLGTAHDRRTA